MIDTLPADTRQAQPAARDSCDEDLLHLAVIMDGNGRWATERGLSRSSGHRAGARTVRAIVEAAGSLGVGTLTLYAFSSDNWSRPTKEIGALMRLFRAYLEEESERCRHNDIRLSIIGRRDRLPPELLARVETSEGSTAGCRSLHLRIALDYSSRDAILRAALGSVDLCRLDPEAFSRLLTRSASGAPAVPDVDLLIRTGGERRLSDFLLWESAYAELYFTDIPWPDFTPADLETAVGWFRKRERRYGRVPKSQQPSPRLSRAT